MNKKKWEILLATSVLTGVALSNSNQKVSADSTKETQQITPKKEQAGAQEQEIKILKEKESQEEQNLLALRKQAEEQNKQNEAIRANQEKTASKIAEQKQEEALKREEADKLNQQLGRTIKEQVANGDEGQAAFLAKIAGQDQDLHGLELQQQEMEQMQGKITQISKSIADNHLAQANIQKQVTQMQALIQEQEVLAANTNGKIKAMQKGIDHDDEQIANLNQLVQEALKEGENEKADGYRKSISDTQKSKKALRKQISSWQKHYAWIKTKSEGFQKELIALKDKLKPLTSTESGLQNDLVKISEQKKTQEDKLKQSLTSIDFSNKNWAQTLALIDSSALPLSLQEDYRALCLNVNEQKELKKKISLSLAALQEQKQLLLSGEQKGQELQQGISDKEKLIAALEQKLLLLENWQTQNNACEQSNAENSSSTYDYLVEELVLNAYWQGQWQWLSPTMLISCLQRQDSVRVEGKMRLKADLFYGDLYTSDGQNCAEAIYPGQELEICEARIINEKLMLRLKNSNYWLLADQLTWA